MLFDTIVAPITGQPPAGVAWVRLSGSEAWSIAAQVFSPWPDEVEPRKALYGRYAAGDDGLALPFSAGHSYTGEESVELSMHGSHASVRAVVDACLAAGARLAEPGEFTQRAFLNGRIDLTQAEAVRETIEALTENQLRQAGRNRDGALRNEIEEVRGELLRILAAIEASVDFSEEIGEFDREGALGKFRGIHFRIAHLQKESEVSRIVREGYRIAIVGPPNAGKSSLLNRLLGTERSIVTAIPGTTRDFVEERADFGGVAVVLIDTAGLRETSDEVEAIGVERTRRIAEGADEIWYVYDGNLGLSSDEADELSAFGRKATPVANKSDLGPAQWPGIPISVKTGENLDYLVQFVRVKVMANAPEIAVNERQASVLAEAVAVARDLQAALKGNSPDDLLSVLFQDLIAILGRITGQTAEPDMIDRIFHDFCVGK
ncbi:tRNA uridine-5-carboxymethylaminomethyl(34) synthesis GTPase MnmE [Fimbriimonas ginsengisoli]|uniref:tRNA modification GTPase MnmE n=1 Tax=Fimbriimonas ginsengisoli Gsoil 348 TaxID=661478 RepID=A0A068NIV5_FIMGI|nr:tRNA uridine-5-carboxymethylaminomethyl(34) synthesis GTPase MnmE [Fimbriimonas ginsengisoli]AIE83402.1 tRNA modification GTPase TrmE [Fimbriimonas ginsengisoli Gsoil 348]